MKTKLKTSTKLQKESILKNKNFLNNQNYILGRSEKKKLLSKFFIAKYYLLLLNTFSLFGFFVNKIIFFILAFLYYMLIKNYISFNKDNLIFIIPIFSFIIFGIFGLIFIGRHIRYKNIKSYFISENKSNWIKEIFNFFITIFLLPILFSFQNSIPMIFSFMGGFIISIFLFLVFSKITSKLNYINILFFPILLTMQFFYSIFIVLYIFFTKRFQKYNIIKKSFISNIFKKFTILEKYFAENKYYKITTKKKNENKTKNIT